MLVWIFFFFFNSKSKGETAQKAAGKVCMAEAPRLRCSPAGSCKAGSATGKGCGRSSQFTLLLPGTKRKKEVADPGKRCPYGVMASTAVPPHPWLRQHGSVRASWTSAPPPELCFWKASHLSHLTEGLHALCEHQFVPQSDRILGEKGRERDTP